MCNRRTDNSYARFQEALGTWVDLKTESKNLIRNYFSWVKDRRLQTMVLRWTVAFSRTLAVQVRAQSDLPAQLDGILKPNEIARLMGSSNKPQYILQVLTELMHQGGLPDQREQRVLESVQAFNTASATCEKLLKYPIPLPYTRHTSRFMVGVPCLTSFQQARLVFKTCL